MIVENRPAPATPSAQRGRRLPLIDARAPPDATSVSPSSSLFAAPCAKRHHRMRGIAEQRDLAPGSIAAAERGRGCPICSSYDAGSSITSIAESNRASLSSNSLDTAARPRRIHRPIRRDVAGEDAVEHAAADRIADAHGRLADPADILVAAQAAARSAMPRSARAARIHLLHGVERCSEQARAYRLLHVPLSRRGAGGAGGDARRGRSVLRRHHRRAGAAARRQGHAARHHQPQARAGAAGRCAVRRARPAELRADRLCRHHGDRRHARPGHRQAQRLDQRGAARARVRQEIHRARLRHGRRHRRGLRQIPQRGHGALPAS